MQPASQATSSSFSPNGGSVLPAAGPEPGFVINLCASTTPMALPRHEHPELKRFTFFISRRREDGRERFRLHMGYFQTQEGAERLLELVREIYPAAWAGVAPGQRLRASAAAPEPAVPPPSQVMPPVVAEPLAAKPAAELPAAPAPATVPAAAIATPEPARSAAAQSLHSVRAAIDSLEPAKASAVALAVPPTVVMPELRAVPVVRPVAAPAPATAPLVRPAAPGSAALSDSQVLRVLEAPAATAAPRSETAAYAVQLLWSVQQIDMGAVPQLAIFSAYTLYGAAGNRDGRRWYGLRLGFFTDAVSARQVANYVRSEFASVSIVPVSARERERALAAAPRTPLPETGTVAKKAAVSIASSGEFRLLDEPPAVARQTAPAATAAGTRTAPGKRARLRTPAAGPDGAALPKRRAPLSLEETLEILGAGELKLQDGRDDPLNDSGIRHLHTEAIKSRRASRFTRLMDRLSERFGGG
ncbi:MAG: hypothetical protein IT480_08625 [Gammaproteobacteria bacterium]|nr:hypothetical protein [Gammaproteobacteria bacterium]